MRSILAERAAADNAAPPACDPARCDAAPMGPGPALDPRGVPSRGGGLPASLHMAYDAVSMNTIVWFRQDLRLADNPALAEAVARGGGVVPVYVWAPEEEGDWPPGAASRWWLHQSLAALDVSLARLDSKLVVRRGPTLDLLLALAREVKADAIFWNRRYEPAAIVRDAHVKKELLAAGFDARSFNASLMHEPWTVANKAGKPFQVFTPFWRACLASRDADFDLLPRPRRLRPPDRWPSAKGIENLELEPQVDWVAEIREAWVPGEEGAHLRLRAFLRRGLQRYPAERDRPDHEGVSRLSPHLHFGEIGPRQIVRAIQTRAAERPDDGMVAAAESYVRQIGWREFAHHLLYHFPHTPDRPLRPEYASFPWRRDAGELRVWRRGRTGYGLVDAGMAQLWRSGWMHNRVRMVVASFLVKDLLLPWQEGARWFWDTLVDADLANNTLGWQWAAGCGADAAPYFRIFNPHAQEAKFDPDGAYIRHWTATPRPDPIVDHAAARARALAALAAMKSKARDRQDPRFARGKEVDP
jgi:deoxyribodipyrimidine photo-lyase